MTDFYLAYSQWFQQHYNRPFTVTREEWQRWCSQPRSPVAVTDTQFDYDKELEGDAQ